MSQTNATHRLFVEKLGDTKREEFTGNRGEIFYEPCKPEFYLSDGETVGGIPIIAEAVNDIIIDNDDLMPRNLNKLGTLPS